MRQRILGFGGGRRRRRVLLATMALAVALGAFLISNAMAVHDLGLFELDRNATDESGAPLPDDWATLFNDNTAPFGGSELFTGILPDITPDPGGNQFQGGGSKDNNDITEWLWKAGEPLDKDDITNAYAAGYINQTDTGENDVGDFIVYFGLDRFANNGSAQVGFWFFKSEIGLTNNAAGGGFEFSGQHQVGDVLVQSNFSQGGTVDSVSVFEWVGSGGSHGSLNLLTTAQDCAASAADDAACATVNQGDTPSPWPYTPKAGSPGTFPQGSFFEGGINLSRLVPSAGCLSTFLAETRSSTPFDARLKDLRLGDFNTCRVAVDTDANPTGGDVTPGTEVRDTATVTGSSLIGGTAPTPTGTVDFFLCQPSEVTAAGCPTGSGSKVGVTKTLDANGQATSDATTNTTAIGKYCWRAEYTPAADSPYSAASFTNATDECFTTVAQPTTTTTRQFVYPQDKAKITASSGGALNGNVTFELFDSLEACSANAADTEVYSETIAVSGAPPQERKTTNYPPDADAYAITDGTTHYWRVFYDSDNPSQLDSLSNCVESTDVDFGTGDDATITVP
jgi:hypothetical protein